MEAPEVSKATEEETKNVAASGAEDTKKDEEAGDAEPEKVESIYDSEVPNRIIVGRARPLSFYVDRARRIFRIEEEVFVQGRGENIAATCKLVEALKRQKIATIGKVSTNMDVEPYFNSYGDAKWGRPTAVIVFQLKRGEFGKFIADFQQRKIIEIFENADEKQEGSLSLDKVESLQFGTRFKAKDEQIAEAKEFLSKLSEKQLNLPDFIKYASILIHPLLKARVFKSVLAEEFGLTVAGVSGQRSPNNEEATEEQE